MAHLKKPLNIWQMISLNFGFFGIQFGWALQMANMSGIYKFLGASNSELGYLWLAAPMTGLIIQPILGQLSDRTWTKLGRRRPYILAGAIISSLALFIMPNLTAMWMAAAMLWILDGSINITMQPFRAIVADVAPENQHTKCFSVQTCLVGIGATLASVLPWIFMHLFNMQDITAADTVPLTLKLSFYVGAGVFLLANLWTVFFSREYPPENLTEWRKEKSQTKFTFWSDLKTVSVNFIHMPKVMRQISVVQFFTWAGLFCFFLYYGPGVAQNIFNLPVNADTATDLIAKELLERGIALGGLCFATYTLVSFIYAYFIPHLSRLITRKGAHIVSLLFGAVGLGSSYFIHDKSLLILTMVGLGFAWASIVTVPYAILAGTLPKDKMGVYMGLFNITICVPEIIAALTLGYLVDHVFANRAMAVVSMAGIFFVIAAIFTLFVDDKKVEEKV